jgi:hypothetical protein
VKLRLTAVEAARRGHGRLAVACLLLTVALTLALHALYPELDPARSYVSEYANGQWGWVLTLALLLFAVGSYALASGLREVTGLLLGPRLITLAGACMAIAAVFSTDRYGDDEVVGTLAGRLHGFASIGGFAIVVVAMLLLARPLERDERWGQLGRVTLPLAAASVLALVLAFVAAPDAAGLRQRAFLALVFGWLVVAGFRLRVLEDRAAERAVSAGARARLGT